MIKSDLTVSAIDYAAVDRYVAKGRRERSKAIAAFFRSLFVANRARKAPIRRKMTAGAANA